MATGHNCNESRNSNIVPALALAALAGVAVTYFLTKRAKSADKASPIESVIDLCTSAANKLDQMVAQAS